MFKKTFNRSERAAFLALGELYKQGLVDERVFDFKIMILDQISTDKLDGATMLSRQIIFRGPVEAVVRVNTPIGQGYSDESPSEEISWIATEAFFTRLKDGIWSTDILIKNGNNSLWAARI